MLSHRCNIIKAIIYGSVDSFYNETWKFGITDVNFTISLTHWRQRHCDKKAFKHL